MSREIKFRAWSPGVRQRQFGKWIFEPQMLFDDKPGDCLVWKSQGQNIEVMQYTGLKDKNGVEIYEGDFVKGKYWKNQKPQRIIGRVKYLAPKFMIYGVNQYEGIMVEDLDRSCEVIGSIYDNPDLLEVKP